MVTGRGLAGRADKRLRAAARQAWLGARRRGRLGSQTSGRAPAWLEVPSPCTLPSVSRATSRRHHDRQPLCPGAPGRLAHGGSGRGPRAGRAAGGGEPGAAHDRLQLDAGDGRRVDAEIVSVPTRPARSFILAVPAVLPGSDPGPRRPCRHLRWMAAAFAVSMRTLPLAVRLRVRKMSQRPSSSPCTTAVAKSVLETEEATYPREESGREEENHMLLGVYQY